jgi:hypothetical protein
MTGGSLFAVLCAYTLILVRMAAGLRPVTETDWR